jgi:hypothetical protein
MRVFPERLHLLLVVAPPLQIAPRRTYATRRCATLSSSSLCNFRVPHVKATHVLHPTVLLSLFVVKALLDLEPLRLDVARSASFPDVVYLLEHSCFAPNLPVNLAANYSFVLASNRLIRHCNVAVSGISIVAQLHH